MKGLKLFVGARLIALGRRIAGSAYKEKKGDRESRKRKDIAPTFMPYLIY